MNNFDRESDSGKQSSGNSLYTTIDSEFLSDVISGLSQASRSLPCKYLYDERGSKLFDQICELDEYYLTRTEKTVTIANVDAIAECIGPQAVIVEYGSGSSIKTRVLLEHLNDAEAYVPVDISEDHLLNTAHTLRSDFPHMDIHPVVADFTRPFELPVQLPQHLERVCVYFPGSTIGNFESRSAVELLAKIRRESGQLLVGFDLHKDVDVLELAYDDPHGVTSEFSLNLLHRINRELDGDFNVERFSHVSFYNTKLGRIEIYLRSDHDQQVRIADAKFSFAAGEMIHTEYSHKYTLDGFARLAAQAGWQVDQVWTDDLDHFAVGHLTADASFAS